MHIFNIQSRDKQKDPAKAGSFCFLLKMFFLASFLILPLLIIPSEAATYIKAKSIFLIIITFIIAVISISKYKKISKLPRIFTILFSLLVLSHILSIVFSIDIKESFFGSSYRFRGFLIQFSELLFFYLFCLLIFHEKIISKNILWLLTIPLFINIPLGLLQFLNVSWFPIGTVFSDRIDGTFGNPNMFALYILMIIPLIFFLATNAINKYSKLLAWSAILLAAAMLFLTGSRTGIFIFAIQFTMLFFLNLKNWKHSLLILLFSGGLFLFILNISPALQQRFILTNESAQSLNTRLNIWNISISLFLERPLIGVGHDNFFTAFLQHPIFLEKFDTFLPDKVHNEFLEILVERGIIGLLFYLALIFYCYFNFFKKYRLLSMEQKGFGLTLLIISLSYLAFNQLNFPDTIHSIYFWIANGALAFGSIKA